MIKVYTRKNVDIYPQYVKMWIPGKMWIYLCFNGRIGYTMPHSQWKDENYWKRWDIDHITDESFQQIKLEIL